MLWGCPHRMWRVPAAQFGSTHRWTQRFFFARQMNRWEEGEVGRVWCLVISMDFLGGGGKGKLMYASHSPRKSEISKKPQSLPDCLSAALLKKIFPADLQLISGTVRKAIAKLFRSPRRFPNTQYCECEPSFFPSSPSDLQRPSHGNSHSTSLR